MCLGGFACWIYLWSRLLYHFDHRFSHASQPTLMWWARALGARMYGNNERRCPNTGVNRLRNTKLVRRKSMEWLWLCCDGHNRYNGTELTRCFITHHKPRWTSIKTRSGLFKFSSLFPNVFCPTAFIYLQYIYALMLFPATNALVKRSGVTCVTLSCTCQKCGWACDLQTFSACTSLKRNLYDYWCLEYIFKKVAVTGSRK
jgi:hypothetical protein